MPRNSRTINWCDRDGSEATVVPAFKQAVSGVLGQTHQQLLKA